MPISEPSDSPPAGASRRVSDSMTTAEFLALEQDLEKERTRAKSSLEDVQRGLREAEAGGTGKGARTEPVSREMLIAERDRARASLIDALRRLGYSKVAASDPERIRVDAERLANREADKRLTEHARELESEIATIQAETEQRIQ